MLLKMLISSPCALTIIYKTENYNAITHLRYPAGKCLSKPRICVIVRPAADPYFLIK
jgi:hypothetical protein